MLSYLKFVFSTTKWVKLANEISKYEALDILLKLGAVDDIKTK